MTNKEKALIEIERIKNLLDENKINRSSISEKEYCFEINISLNKKNIKLQIYFGKKGVKTVLQGDTDSKEYKNISNIISENPKLDFKDEIKEPNEYIGSDEAGKGDFFGPLVISAVYVNEKIKKELYELGVRDSKKLSDDKINYLAEKIKKICEHMYSIVKLEPKQYNLLYEKFNNLNKLLSWAHSKAINEVLLKTKCKTVITDKFSKQNLEIEKNKLHFDVEFIKLTKAEKYVGVAAASILARNEFNAWFNLMEKKGLNLPKGSSIITEKKAQKILLDEESIDKSEICKLHFKTLKKLKID